MTNRLNNSHYNPNVTKKVTDMKSSVKGRSKRRSCSGDKNTMSMIPELMVNQRVKHVSPIVDRWILDELKASSTIPDWSNEVANKIYKSKNKPYNIKSITAKDILSRKIEKVSSKHSKNTKSKL